MLNRIKLLIFFVNIFSTNSRMAILGINVRVTVETKIKNKILLNKVIMLNKKGKFYFIS